MVRWSIMGIFAAIAVVAVVGVMLSRPSRSSPSTHKNADTAAVEPTARKPQKPTPQKTERPSDLVDPAQTETACEQVSESERSAIKLPVAEGPLKLLKGRYQDESRDPVYESTEQLIRAQFDPKIFPVERLHAVTCRKSVCKIAVFWSNQQPMILAGVLMYVHPVLSVHYAFEPVSVPDDKGDILVEMYILRKGFELEDLQ